ncbi:SMI1/KNR4 family protein [Streptomyces sp. NPDC006283]|uniref:SMI1/KNR4 family protein n=1 Tax=Streptomyces sp. NPDC006283 TaxID=3156741 RepID=UPI0033B2FC3C
MWRELVEQYDGAELQDPTTPEELRELEEALGQTLPGPLRDLLLESNGVMDEDGTDVVWPTAQIRDNNHQFRTNESFRDLYMPFGPLMFFGDNGGGDQFAFPRSPERDDVFVWDHENDSRNWVASGLEAYLRNALENAGEDWYR